MAENQSANAKRDEGGQAFPQPVTVGPSGDLYPAYPGMSLRDWFAGQALSGILAFPGPVNGSRDKSGRGVAIAAYAYADTMLAERNK